MKRKNKRAMTLKGWITLWFAVLMIGVGALVAVFICLSNREVVDADMEQVLILRVERNARKLSHKGGKLVVGEGFIQYKDGIYCAVFSENGERLYGRMPADTEQTAFTDRRSRSLTVGDEDYYIYDLYVQTKSGHSFWVRGLSPQIGTASTLNTIAKLALIVLPAAIALAIVGGYVITEQLLLPLNDVTRAANSIAADNDLSLRIKYNGGVREITELTTAFNNMFDRLEGSFRRERQFTSDVSHELRTPIAVVLAECEYCLSKEQEPEEYRRSLETVQRQTGRMSGLITQLLSISRLEQGTQKLTLEDVDMGELVLAVCEDQQQITDVKITPVIENDAHASVDMTLMSRLLTNLVGNACKFGSTHVTVRLYSADGRTCIAVEDDGIGIPKAEREKIWERFYQVDRSRSENQSGSCGLGLSIVRQIAQLHGGTVAVTDRPGGGSVFTLSLPENRSC